MLRTLGSSTHEPTALSTYQDPGEFTIGIPADQYLKKCISVHFTGTLEELQKGSSRWKPNIDSRFFDGLQRMDPDGVLRGDLSKTLLKKIRLLNAHSTLPFSVGSSLYDGDNLKTKNTMDRNGKEFGVVINPGDTHELPFFESQEIEPPMEFLKANSLTAEDLQTHQVGSHIQVERHTALGRHCLAQNLQQQWLAANPNHNPVDLIPNTNLILVHPAYVDYVAGNLAKLREASIAEMPKFFTNLSDISLRIEPIHCAWEDLDSHPDLTKMSDYERKHATSRNHTVSFQLELNYAIFDPELLNNLGQ